jgi:hypothetical protein
MDIQHKYKSILSEIPTTAIEVYQMLPEGTRCEVIFNELIRSPLPLRDHQILFIKLTALLYQFLEETPVGMLFAAPFDVYFESQQSAVQPDLFIVLKEDEHIVKKKRRSGGTCNRRRNHLHQPNLRYQTKAYPL